MDKQRYKVVCDLQQGDFAMGLNFTIEQWQKQALMWCYYDDNKGLANYISKLPQDTELLDFIGETWDIEFAPIGLDDNVDDHDRTCYAEDTVEQFYNGLFE